MTRSAGLCQGRKNWFNCGREDCLGNGCRLKRRQVRQQAGTSSGIATGWCVVRKRLSKAASLNEVCRGQI